MHHPNRLHEQKHLKKSEGAGENAPSTGIASEGRSAEK